MSETILKQLPEPAGLFEKAVFASLTQSIPLPPAPSQCTDLDELRLASALGIHPEVVFSSPLQFNRLALVWWATPNLRNSTSHP